ncbi:hypothetical protein [Paenibacillus sp. OSY-SE]|uniref:hypothetical protein n=1 Tax=Paenibacillus sp. OSY-SE TaxID=1196323 RepID=UPI0002E0D246|nr:hypothetical protein [Paenibacillus sp. OSY-SE]
MKYAYITDLNGRYIEPTLVADSVTGVFDRREPVQSDDEQPNEPETILVGYMVAVPLPAGLYEPIFDVEGYRQAMTDYEAAYAEYIAAVAEHDPEEEEPQPKPPLLVDGPLFWRNGLTQEEIEALQPKPVPSELEFLGQQMVARELEALELRQQNGILGEQIVQKELEILDLQTQNETLGSNLVGMDLRLLTLEGVKQDV